MSRTTSFRNEDAYGKTDYTDDDDVTSLTYV